MAFKRVYSLWRPSVDFSKAPSLTRQEFLADADINNIVAKFLHTGVLNQPNLGRPSVDGLDSPGDFTEACDMYFNNEAQNENDVALNSSQSSFENDLLTVPQGTSGQEATSGNQNSGANVSAPSGKDGKGVTQEQK